MSFRAVMKVILPDVLVAVLNRVVNRPSRARREGNKWLHHHCGKISGRVLSIGSGSDADNQGDFYRNYFPRASSYTTSDVSECSSCDLTLDIRSMPQIGDESYDCIFCSGVLEHVDDCYRGLREITRILKNDGFLILGLPFRQALHMAPQDFWRFTEFGVKYMLRESYEIVDFIGIDNRVRNFPSAYLVKARKVSRKAPGERSAAPEAGGHKNNTDKQSGEAGSA